MKSPNGFNLTYSETFYPYAVDTKTVNRYAYRFVMGRFPSGRVVVKQITLFGNCGNSVLAWSIELKRLREQHFEPVELPYGGDQKPPIDEGE